jgi:hypothetical protein
MTFGFPAYAEDGLEYGLPHKKLVDAVEDALTTLGWAVENCADWRKKGSSGTRFHVKVSMGLWSWGEKLTINIHENGLIHARSECLLPTQCLDWGKNGRNLKRFFDELDLVVNDERG